MRTVILLKFVFFIIFSVRGQNNIEVEKQCKEFITSVLDKIKDYKPTNLVPYSPNGLEWYLMDIGSKKIVTQSLSTGGINVFKPNFHLSVNKNCSATIYKDYTFQCWCIFDEIVTVGVGTQKKISSKATLERLGFQVDKEGKMVAYSKSYEDNLDAEDIAKGIFTKKYISNPFMHRGKYYVVLPKEGKEVVIDEQGNELENFAFEFIFPTQFRHKGEKLFYVKDFDGKIGLITLSGKKILYGELINGFHWYRFSNFGYSVQHNANKRGAFSFESIEKSGILDLTTQKWLIKPQERYKIYDIIYTSEEEISEKDETNPNFREKVNIYFLATNGKEFFVLDKNGKEIKPQ